MNQENLKEKKTVGNIVLCIVFCEWNEETFNMFNKNYVYIINVYRKKINDRQEMDYYWNLTKQKQQQEQQ